MALTQSQKVEIDSSAPDFNLPATNGQNYSLDSFKNAHALVIVFTCNHCPYAKAAWPLLVKLAQEFKEKGVAFIGINPNNNYFVAMDPVYMWHKDKNLYQQYRMVALGQDKDPYTTLKNVFKINYGYAGKLYFWALVGQVKKDNRFEVMQEDQLGIIFRLKEI